MKIHEMSDEDRKKLEGWLVFPMPGKRREQYDIEMHEVSAAFRNCWSVAGHHIQRQVQDKPLNWLKSNLVPPFLEHLSFRLGNQLFFVRIEDVEETLEVPGSRRGLLSIAAGCEGHPCIMPMRCLAGSWEPVAPGWGLIDARTGRDVDPFDLVSDEKIEMSEWELHDFAVQVVKDHVEKKLGFELMSFQGNPNVNPSIWFVGNKGPEWVVVRAVRYPQGEAAPPSNVREIAESCAHLSRIGHFASVAVANGQDAFDPAGNVAALPLWRGHGMSVRFEGLVPIAVQ